MERMVVPVVSALLGGGDSEVEVRQKEPQTMTERCEECRTRPKLSWYSFLLIKTENEKNV